jgi:hypothetical protein
MKIRRPTNFTCCAPKTESEDAHACSEDGDLRILMANPWSRPHAPEDRGQSTRRCLASGKRVLDLWFTARRAVGESLSSEALRAHLATQCDFTDLK